MKPLEKVGHSFLNEKMITHAQKLEDFLKKFRKKEKPPSVS